MAKTPPGNSFQSHRGVSLKGSFYTVETPFGVIIKRWPRKQPTARTQAEADNRKLLGKAARFTAYMSAGSQTFARDVAARSKLLPRDLLVIALFNRLGYVIQRDGKKIFSMVAMQDVSSLLDAIGQVEGDMLIRGKDWWIRFPKGDPSTFLGIDENGDFGWFEVGGGGGGSGTGVQISKQSGNQSVPSFTHNPIDFDTVDYMDIGYSVDLATNKITVLEDGYYALNVFTRYTTGYFISDILTIELNGTICRYSPQSTRNNAYSTQLNALVKLQAGDVLQAFQDSDTSASFTNATSAPGTMFFSVNLV